MDNNPAITAIAEKIVENIQSYLSITLNPLENYFVFQNLYSINIQKRECSNDDKRLAEEITTELITKFF
ncbi:MAG: BglG family transcription antiterminator, partial [Enterococcus viikkiensis]